MTIEEITTRKECQTFDCKSIQIEPKALAVPIVAMANADGGVLAIGVSDKARRIEGVDGNEKRLNELLRVPFDFCNPSVKVRLVRPDNIRHTHFSRNPKIAQYLKAYKYVKEFGEGIDRICCELETKGCAIPSFHADAFILKATLMAEWTTGKEFDRPSTAQDNDTVNVPINDTIKLSQLTERQRKIYEIIKNRDANVPTNVPINVPINVSGLATMFNVSEKTIKRDLYVLRDLNLIIYIGSNKTGHWEAII